MVDVTYRVITVKFGKVEIQQVYIQKQTKIKYIK